MQEKDLNTPLTTNGKRGISLWGCLGLCAAILSTGIFLFWIGDGFPPLAWRQVAQLLGEHTPPRSQFLLVLGQVAFLVAAWGLLLILTIQSMFHLWHDGLAVRTRPRPHEPHLSEHSGSSGLLESRVPPLQQIPLDTTSESLPRHLNRVGGQSLPLKVHHRDVSPPLQVAGMQPPAPVPTSQPALFGERMQLTVGSCSVEGLQHEPSRTAYLLTDGGSETNTSFSWPVALFALADHIPRDEPGHTRSCQAIETMRDRVRHACTSNQLFSDETLVALVAEQVQNVTRVIKQQSQDEEVNPAIAVVLVVGSQLYLANLGDTRVYLCCSQDGFYQITDVLRGVRLLTSQDRTTARPSSEHTGGKSQGQRMGPSRTRQEHGLALPLAPGDSVLLCSDGLWSVLHAAYLEYLIRSAGPDPTAMCSALVRAVRTSGSTDAMHMIVVYCQGS